MIGWRASPAGSPDRVTTVVIVGIIEHKKVTCHKINLTNVTLRQTWR